MKLKTSMFVPCLREENEAPHVAWIRTAILDQEQDRGWGRHHAKQSLEMEQQRSSVTLLGYCINSCWKSRMFWIFQLLEGIYSYIVKGNLSWEFAFLTSKINPNWCNIKQYFSAVQLVEWESCCSLALGLPNIHLNSYNKLFPQWSIYT